MERIITAHSAVHSAGELQQFGNCIRRLTRYDRQERFSPELFTRAQELDPRVLGDEYLLRTTRLRGTLPRFVDKLPQNYLYIPVILKALPNAKIVHGYPAIMPPFSLSDPELAALIAYMKTLSDKTVAQAGTP